MHVSLNMDASDGHYYAEISETLGIGIADDFPINQKFIGLKDIVKSLSAERKYYRHPNPDGLKDYSQKPYSGLLQDCKDHLNDYRQKIINVPTVLALVHPFYAFLSHWEKFANSNRTEKAMKYLDVLVMSLEYLLLDKRSCTTHLHKSSLLFLKDYIFLDLKVRPRRKL